MQSFEILPAFRKNSYRSFIRIVIKLPAGYKKAMRTITVYGKKLLCSIIIFRFV
jgi:hypothetical protein